MTITKNSVLSVILTTLLIAAPNAASAATSKPTCSLTATSASDSVTTRDEDTLSIHEGEAVSLSWTSKNATSATDSNGKSVGVSGIATVTPATSETYDYTFKSGSKKVTCSIEVAVTGATINIDSLTVSSGKKPSLSGTASGVKEVRISITKADSSGDEVFKKTVKVSHDRWKLSVSKKLSDGAYTVSVYGPGGTTLTQGALAVGNVAVGSLAVSNIPLLTGGTAARGTTVPISYLQVTNTGKTPVSIAGFRVQQTGTAPVSSITGFSSVDGTGTSRASTSGLVTFTNGVAEVPSTAVLAAGERKLFTLKATVGPAATVGTNLKLNVVSIDTLVSSIKATFPIVGTTWTISAY